MNPSPDAPRLETERLVLRPLNADDAAALFEVFGDPLVMRYWSTPPWPSIATAHDYIAREREAAAAGCSVRFGIERRGDSHLIGTCTLFNLSTPCRRAEIGYGLASAAWRHGYITEALTAFIDWAFPALALNRIEADIDPRNAASAKSLVRLGFRHEGHLRERWIVDGEVSDSALYGLLRRDWAAIRGA